MGNKYVYDHLSTGLYFKELLINKLMFFDALLANTAGGKVIFRRGVWKK